MSACAGSTGQLVGQQRILGADAQHGSVGDGAVQAVVGGAGGHHDHLPLGEGQAAVAPHQGVVVRQEGSQLCRPVGERQEHVRHEARFGCHLLDSLTQIVGEFG